MDTLRVLLLRILAGTSPFAPDKNHIHHRLIDLGLSQIGTLIVLAAVNLIAISIAVIFSDIGNNNLLLILISYALIFSIIVELLRKNPA